MGTRHHTYVGPYISCKIVRRKTKFDYYCCDNSSCKEYDKEVKYYTIPYKKCGECGNDLVARQRTKIFKFKDTYEIVGDALSELPAPNEDEEVFLVPNKKFAYAWRSNGGDPSETHYISNLNIQEAIELFRNDFANEITALRLEYEDIVIGFAIHNYWA